MLDGKTNCSKCGNPIKIPDNKDLGVDTDTYIRLLQNSQLLCIRCHDKAREEWENKQHGFEQKYKEATKPCYICEGKGEINGDFCETCDGKGRIKKSFSDPCWSDFFGFKGISCEDA